MSERKQGEPRGIIADFMRQSGPYLRDRHDWRSRLEEVPEIQPDTTPAEQLDVLRAIDDRLQGTERREILMVRLMVAAVAIATLSLVVGLVALLT